MSENEDSIITGIRKTWKKL